jgi:GxxExxY protein
MELIHQELTYKIRGVLFDVYNQLGPNLPERFYQAAIAIGLEGNGIPCQTEKQFEVIYRGIEVGRYFVDVWVNEGDVLLELKVASEILPIHKAQILNYLKITGTDLGLLVNFGGDSLVVERLPNFVRDKRAEFCWQERPFPPNTLFPQLTNQVLKALHQVHFSLQPGFLHQVYRRAAMIELREQEISYDYIKTTPIFYHNQHLGDQDTRLINIENKILIAAIAVQEITQAMKNQLRAYLKHHGVPLGILANFNNPKLHTVFLRP